MLNEISKDKYFLLDTISKVAKTKKINHSPLLIVNLLPYDWHKKIDTDTIQLHIKKKDITSISFLEKESAKKIYGKRGENGVVLIRIDSINK